MDPKQLEKLDPKLKETYNRVMNTPLQQGQPASSTPISPLSSSQPTTPLTENSSPNHPLPSFSAPTPPQPSQAPTPVTPLPKVTPPPPPSTPSSHSTSPQTHGFVVKSEQKSVPGVVYVLLGIVFFIVYALAWIKFFNFPLPSIPFLQ